MTNLCHFYHSNIVKDILYLTSEETKGRLSGTEGARKAALYLANELKNAGYEAIGTNDYFDPVEVPATRLIGPARLKVGDREFTHRVYFAEWLSVSSGGELAGDLLVVKEGDEIHPSELKGKIVLIPARPDGFDVKNTVKTAADFGIKGLLIESGNPKFFSKSIFGSKENQIPVFKIRQSIVEELVDLKGMKVMMQLPLEIETRTCQNVLGYYGNPEKKHTLLLSAHYDHLGDDPNGFRIAGAIDNASGVAVVMEAARRLSQMSNFPFNIMIAFLTGEESSMIGAGKLVDSPPVAISMVINVDCLGFENELVALRVGHSSPGHWLPDLASKVIEDFGVEVKWIAGGDDSAAFLSKGIPTLGLGQKPTSSSSIPIHSPEDSFENLHLDSVENGFNILMTIIEKLVEKETLVSQLLLSQSNLKEERDHD